MGQAQGILLAGRRVPVGETVLYDSHQRYPGMWGRVLYRARILAVEGDTCRVRLDTGEERDVPVVFLSAYTAAAVAAGARIREVP